MLTSLFFFFINEDGGHPLRLPFSSGEEGSNAPRGDSLAGQNAGDEQRPSWYRLWWCWTRNRTRIRVVLSAVEVRCG